MRADRSYLLTDLDARLCETDVTHPDVACDCPDWNPGIDKLNGPIITAQLRRGKALPPNYFIAWRYCPWCGKTLAAPPSKSAVEGPSDVL